MEEFQSGESQQGVLSPLHLGSYPCSRAAYTGLYEHMPRDVFIPPSKRIRIPDSVQTEIGVYRLLPSAPDFEYGGWLTPKCIFYSKGEAIEAYGVKNHAQTTFHSHPTASEGADIPSNRDLRNLLAWPQIRQVIVGDRYILVLDKTAQTLPVIENLIAWECQNLLPTMKQLAAAGGDFLSRYCDMAIHTLIGDRDRAMDLDDADRWPTVVRKNLKLRVRRFRR